MVTETLSSERLSWAEIQKKYPDQWVFILQPEEGICPQVLGGIVKYSAPTKQELYAYLIASAPVPQPYRIKFTGIITQPDHRWRNVYILNETTRKNSSIKFHVLL